MPGHLSHAVVTLTGTGNVLNLGTLIEALEIGIKATDSVLKLDLQPLGTNAGVVYGGGRSTLTTTNYGFRLEVPVSTVPQAPYPAVDAANRATVQFDDLYLIGTNNDKVACFIERDV